jgi:DNA-binding NarL/FixJ family response regulator
METNGQNRIRVMVVDDHFVVRIGVSVSINAEADMVVVAEATTGERALAMYRKQRPDIVLMDLKLPGMNGVDATRAICAEFPKAAIVVFASQDSEEDIYRSLRAGARAYLLKTGPRRELINTIRAVHSGKRCISPAIGVRLAERMNHPDLTARESEVLDLIVKGKSNKEIGVSLSIAEATVKLHTGHIFAKMGVQDRTQATTAALQRGLARLD